MFEKFSLCRRTHTRSVHCRSYGPDRYIRYKLASQYCIKSLSPMYSRVALSSSS